MEVYDRSPARYGSQPGYQSEWRPADAVAELKESVWHLTIDGTESHPERPGVADCVYYMRTGLCGYGSRCRYNHPRHRAAVAAAVRATGECPERVGEPICQFYLKTGSCKFGGSCKFHHPKHGGGSLSQAPLNIYGYPLRPGEKECLHYLKTGQCRFGATCKFDHPQAIGKSSAASALQFYQQMQSPLVPLPPKQASVGPVLSPGALPPRAQPAVGTSLYGTQLSSSTPAFAGPYTPLPSSGPSVGSQKDQVFPERPGEAECQYYLRTGDCRFGLTCRYHHPQDVAVTRPLISPVGLPLCSPPASEGSLKLINPNNHEKSGQPYSSMDYGEMKQPFIFEPMMTMSALPLSQQERPNEKLKLSQAESMQVENSIVPMANEDLPLISHCFLFPFGYEFAKEELVRLWIAEGLFQRNQNQRDRVEDVANDKFDSLVSEQIIVPSRNDQTLDFRNPEVRKQLYKLNESKVSFLEHAACSEDKYVRVCDGKFNHLSENVLHLSVLCKNVDDTAFESIRRLKHLRTLLFIPDFGLSVERLPRNLFSSLKQLRALNFSWSRMSELPSSIGNLKALQYIDLSYTPIKQLPDSIDTLQSLQTLKLEECFNLIGLPNGTSKLTNLRHLVLDVIGQLKSMPPKLGNLANLQTLSAFLVGRDYGRKIGELKNAIDLTGSFCISRLENVSNREEAREANLINKKFLNTLELRWWNDKRVNSSEEEEILKFLQPPLGLKELRILNYGGFKLPTWICHRSYECLVNLSLYNCTNCLVLPAVGELPLLQFLHIKEMNKLERIDHQFCRDICDHNKQDYHSFPSLKTLIFEDMPELEEWTGIQSGDFPSLHKLQVKYCPKLTALPSLSFFNSLKHLEVSYCPSVLSCIESKEDVSLEFLLINGCPELKKLFKRPEGRDWEKIAHVPNMLIDDEQNSCQWTMD